MMGDVCQEENWLQFIGTFATCLNVGAMTISITTQGIMMTLGIETLITLAKLRHTTLIFFFYHLLFAVTPSVMVLNAFNQIVSTSSVIMLIAIMLNVIILNALRLSVVTSSVNMLGL